MSPHRRLPRHARLLGGASAVALLAAGAPVLAAPASPFARVVDPAAAVAAAVQARAAQGAAANAASAQTLADFARASALRGAMDASQAAARAAAQAAASAVPNGLTTGGLQVAPGATPGSSLWIGANAPTQTATNGRTAVSVTQTAPQAILNWQTFNVGKTTDLSFGQQASSWVVLNRVTDPSTNPTQILGTISAPGTVLIMNANGVIFGGASQINVGSLLAGAANITDAQFLDSGIYSTEPSNNYQPAFTAAAGAVSVEAGAQITTATPTLVTSGGGYVLLLGKQVRNAGDIKTPEGQTLLAAGDDFLLRPGYSTTGNAISTTRGSEVAVQLDTPGSSLTGGSGLAVNTGVIEADTGDITLAGETVVQAGGLVSTTSVNTRGTIHLLSSASDPYGAVTLSADSLAVILPDTSGATALDSQREALIAQSSVQNVARGNSTIGQFDDLSLLADQAEDSRIEIVSNAVEFQSGSLSLASGGQIAVSATSRVQVDNGATLDVSGLPDVTLPMSSNNLLINIQGNETRDNPVNQDSPVLNNNNVYVDARGLTYVPAGTGGDTSDRYYTPGGLLEVSGYIGTTPHTIGEWMAIGGTIMLSTGAEGAVVSQTNSKFNISGGFLQYQSGYVNQSYLIASNGGIYNVNQAPADLHYVGVYDGFTVDHPHWGVSQTYLNPLLDPARFYEPGYTIGRDGGQLVLSTPTSLFQGQILAGVYAGTTQVDKRPGAISDPFLLSQQVAPLAGSLALGNYSFSTEVNPLYPTVVLISEAGGTAADGLAIDDRVARSLTNKAQFSASQLEGLGGLSIKVGDNAEITRASIVVDAPLNLAPGATLLFDAPRIDVQAAISAPSGAIALETTGTAPVGAKTSISLASTGSLTATGLSENASLDPVRLDAGAFIDGGVVTLDSNTALDLEDGSTIDTSAGALISSSGAFTGGAGGSVSITADDPTGVPPVLRPVTVQSEITSYGVGKSGVLTLTVPTVRIGDNPTNSRRVVTLSPDFFHHGFDAYVVNGFAGAGLKVDEGTELSVVAPVLVRNPGSASRTSPELSVFLPPEYILDPLNDAVIHRTGASLTLESVSPYLVAGAGVTVNRESLISVDQGQSVTLLSQGQLTEKGAIEAPAGAISLFNTQTYEYVDPSVVSTVSVWIGPHAVLNTSGVAETALDIAGRTFGVVPNGGSINIGSAGNFDNPANYSASEAFIFLRPGAVLEASGASAMLDVLQPPSGALSSVAGAPALVGGNGGTISFVSANGIYLDGAMTADAGSATAQGGALRIQLDTDQYMSGSGITDPAWVLTPHAIVVSEQTQATPLPAGLRPKDNSFLDAPGVIAGQAAISEQQIEAGGFTNLTLLARDLISFDGNVRLHTGQSVSLTAFTFTDTSPTGVASIIAPYVLLAGAPIEQGLGPNGSFGVTPLISHSGEALSQNFTPCIGGAAVCSRAVLTVTADQIDLENDVRFGASATLTDPTPPGGGQPIIRSFDEPGFNHINLDSSGDIRFAASSVQIPGPTDVQVNLMLNETSFETAGDLSFSAQRVYAGTAVDATIEAGVEIQNFQSGFYPHALLRIVAAPTPPEGAPLSAFGFLNLYSTTVDQGGNLYAPLGNISIYGTTVNLEPGSLTSVSAAGLTIPFGGTTDGVTYNYAGQALSITPASYGANYSSILRNTTAAQGILLSATVVNGAPGSVLDASGGGTLLGGGGELIAASGGLTGQGFISGSGGSTDVLYSTPITFNAAAGTATQTLASRNTTSGAGIYAILPSAALSYAPNATFDESPNYAGSLPGVGEQVTIGSGVSGLPAGTYTLLPSYYAILPGAYRVQFSQGAATSTLSRPQSPDGVSTIVDGYLGVANTTVRNALPTQLLITPSADLSHYSQYDKQDFASYAIAQSAALDQARPLLPQDAGFLTFSLQPPALGAKPSLALQFSGITQLQAAPGGYDGSVTFTTQFQSVGPQPAFVVLAPGEAPAPGAISVTAASIDALDAPLLQIGGSFGGNISVARGSGGIEMASSQYSTVMVDSGATIDAGAIWLFATNQITVAPGATLSTLGRTVNLPDSSTGTVFVGGNIQTGGIANSTSIPIVGVANGDYVAYSPTSGIGGVTIGDPGGAPARLFANDFVGIFGGGTINIASNTRIGAATFEIAVPAINLGDVPAGASAPTAFNLTQAALDQLLAGDPGGGAPAVTTLDLAAADSINLFGSVTLNDSAGGNARTLLLSTPALYGSGAAGDVATINVDNLIWTGGAGAPGPVIANGPGTGQGTLNINAQQITIGYPTQAQAQDNTTIAHLILGFSAVNLTATDFFSANNHASLAVYQAQGAYQPGSGYSYSGGAINLITPVLTTAPGAVFAFSTGGAFTLSAPANPGSATLPTGLGGEIDISAQSIVDTSQIVLPSGRLVLHAVGDVTLGASSRIDLAGLTVPFFDVTQQSWGGTLVVESANGDISQDARSSIDVSATAAAAGAVDLTATSGALALDGAITGAANPGFAAGVFDARARSLGDVTALNDILNAGGVFGDRAFEQTGPGDLVIGGNVKASQIAISVDQGALTVTGKIDASGPGPGAIDLAAANGLTLAATAVLDAHATGLRVDSDGAPIGAANTAHVSLTALGGLLTIDPGATFDLTSPDGVDRGQVEINVARTGATSGDANISSAGPINMSGVSSLAVNAFWTYTPDNSAALGGGVVTQASLNSFDADSTAFINAALADGLVNGKLAGLSAYAGAFHLRPGVQIMSSADVAGGDLTIQGDLDLSGERYQSVNPATQLTSIYGSGEPGILWMRAAGDLNVYGSINDGFAPPPRTPDDDGWVLQSGVNPSGQAVALPLSVTLAGLDGPNGATTYPVGNYTLTYAVTIADGAYLNAGAPAPATVALTRALTVSSDFVLNGTLTDTGGHMYLPGQVVPAGTVFGVGSTIAAGTILPVQAAIGGVGAAGVTLAPGTNFSIFASSVKLENDLTLQAGDVIPAFASVQFSVPGETYVDTRVTQDLGGASVQGQLWALSPMLAPGDLSWSLRLVSGANVYGADSRAVQALSALDAGARPGDPTPGSLTLSDAHFGEQVDKSGALVVDGVVDFSVVRTGTGYLDLVSGGSITQSTLYGVYTAGSQAADVAAAYDLPRPGGMSPLGVTGDLIGVNGATYNQASRDYQAYYPTGGGDLLVKAQVNVVGDTYEPNTAVYDAATITYVGSSNLSNWLWRQGSANVASAWWINFGAYVDSSITASKAQVYLVGFTGFGTLGGGNVTIDAGANAGMVPGAGAYRSGSTASGSSGGVDAVVASAGRVDMATGQVDLTGGGDLSLLVGGALNPAGLGSGFNAPGDNLNGNLVDMRGDLTVSAGEIGTVIQTYALQEGIDPRPSNPFVSESFDAYGGPNLILGDASAVVNSRGDMAIASVDNPTSALQVELLNQKDAAPTFFSLWRPSTAVHLASAGGAVVPVEPDVGSGSNILGDGYLGALLYPPILDVTAFSGNIELDTNVDEGDYQTVDLAPSPVGRLQMLAGNSIYDVTGGTTYLSPDTQIGLNILGSDLLVGNIATPQTPSENHGYFSNGVTGENASGVLHQDDPTPVRFYAVDGDIVGLITGQVIRAGFSNPELVLAAEAVQVHAGRDVVGLKDVALNNNPYDVSTIEAGRDIFYANAQVAGPGLLLVQAGRNVYQGDQGDLTSIGEIGQALTQATSNDGAGITVLAGVGAEGPALTDFADLYLNPANLADPNLTLQDQPGKVVRTYQAQLLAWMQSRFGYSGPASDVLAAFQALPSEQRTVFLLQVYFAELNQSGLDYNDPNSRFFHSYQEGNEAISTLFSATDLSGQSPASGGSLIMFSGLNADGAVIDSGIHTQFGGGITTVVPYGQTVLGNFGVVPGAGTGLLTQGSGDIDVYSYGSIVLGQSRVFTTFGGNILMWLASDGEINAGRGSKTGIVFSPPRVSYTDYGAVTIAPQAPSTGAGIATLKSLAQVPPGDINLIAPVGSIDVGEAGIRVSGNLNIAALHVIDASNIQVQGATTGLPVATSVSVGALTAANNASAAVTQIAQQIAQQTAPLAPPEVPMILSVRFLGFGDQ